MAAIAIERGENQAMVRLRSTAARQDSTRRVHHDVLVQPVASVSRTRWLDAWDPIVPLLFKRTRGSVAVYAIRERVPILRRVRRGPPSQSPDNRPDGCRPD